MNEEQMIKRISRKIKFVKILKIFFSKRIAIKIAIFVSNYFGWIFGQRT